jgi:hypothetical protein
MIQDFTDLKEIALLQAEASACGLGLANVLFVGWVFIVFRLSYYVIFNSELQQPA